MPIPGSLVRYADSTRVVVARADYFGLPSLDLVGPPRRFFSDGEPSPPLWDHAVDARRVTPVPSPAASLALTPSTGWLNASEEAQRRLASFFLIAEDPQGRFITRGAATLAHQASLVQHILEEPSLDRVLIADEVGLGKTIEAGLLIAALLKQQPELRVLYLAPARLVANVHREMNAKLGLPFRRWSASDLAPADLALDALVVASIHRAVVPLHRERVATSGPWHVLVVDECHHLTAHGAGARSANEHFRLVRDMIGRLPPGGRVVMLSGTPHQGNTERFENLIHLLRGKDEPASSVPGRVIFRTKDDVRDWHGRPLFPGRDVRLPVVVSLGKDYRDWYDGIAGLYDTSAGSAARRRASGWARGQALQWAASSVEAGLGFLCRLALRRLSWTPDNAGLSAALAALRPYKGGSSTESIASVYERMRKEIERQRADDDVEDLEEVEEDSQWRPDATILTRLLKQGTAMVDGGSASAKWKPLLELLRASPKEKFVLFAQPVETVSALVQLIRREMHLEPALIVGGQNDTERDAAIRSFWKPNGPRILVSSSAGGEGINLQVSRRLIHLDVPWNPMQMEQRVGRIHRFGSRETVLVDTIVVEGTREVDAYRYARQKLRVAFGDLAADPSRFETLYSRVMSLVPPEEFEEILGEVEENGKLNTAEGSRLGALIQEGLRRWSEFHTRFAELAKSIRAVQSGAADWEDLARFARSQAGAEEAGGFIVQGFAEGPNGVVATSSDVPVLRLGDRVFVAADTAGVPATDASGNVAEPLGVNVVAMARALRRGLNGSQAAWLRPPEGRVAEFDALLPAGWSRPMGALAIVRQRLRTGHGNVFEQSTDMRIVLVSSSGERELLANDRMAAFIRLLLEGVRQRSPVGDQTIIEGMKRAELEESQAMGRAVSSDDFAAGIRHAVWPVFAAVVG